MILSELRDYLQQNRRAALVDIVHRFDVDPSAARSMLERWLQKGKVRKLPAGTACDSGCARSDHVTTETYEWRG